MIARSKILCLKNDWKKMKLLFKDKINEIHFLHNEGIVQGWPNFLTLWAAYKMFIWPRAIRANTLHMHSLAPTRQFYKKIVKFRFSKAKSKGIKSFRLWKLKYNWNENFHKRRKRNTIEIESEKAKWIVSNNVK